MPALSHQAAEALGLLLGQLRLRATVTYQGQLCGRWGLDTSGAGRAGFHLVLKGRCWLRCGSDAERELVAGDLVLLPRDAPHLIRGERHPAQPGVEAVWPLGADAPPGSTALVCGRFELSPGVAGPLLSALPACFVFRCGREGGDPWPRVLVERLLREATESGAASNVVIEHIVDLLFVEAIRHHVSEQPESVGLLRALADPRLARALHGMHSDLARAWTVDSLAEMAGMSRSAFAESFRSLLGETPMRYLARWRVHVAAVWLTESDATVLEVALRVGYQTEAAFSRAFKRELGTTPGSLRT